EQTEERERQEREEQHEEDREPGDEQRADGDDRDDRRENEEERQLDDRADQQDRQEQQRERKEGKAEQDAEENPKRQGEQPQHGSRSCRLFTCRLLQEVRGAELIGRSTRRRRREVDHRLLADALVEALHHHRLAASRPLRLREAEDYTKTNKQDDNEEGARGEPLQRADRNLGDAAVHPSAPSTCGGFGSGTS